MDDHGRTRDESPWLATTDGPRFSALSGDRTVDVVVIGGGIAGLSTAVHLAESGTDVAVIERDRVGAAVTGHTTAKVTSQHGLKYDHLLETVGEERARQYAEANEAALAEVAERSEEFDAEFERRDAYLYAEDSAGREQVREEARAAGGLGLPAEFVEPNELDLPYDTAGAVRFSEQGQFHPRKYVLGLAEGVEAAGGTVFEETRATDLEVGEPCEVTTQSGVVAADAVVCATHFPVFDRGGYFARMETKRSHVIGVRVAGDPPKGMYYKAGDPYRSIRVHRLDGEPLVLVGGENHETGRGGSTKERYERLAEFAREHFDVREIAYRWSTQDYKPFDGVPYIGRLGPVGENAYVATGFGGWGMTGGVAAGRIIAGLIDEGEHPQQDVFSPARITEKSAASFLTHNAAVGANFTADWARSLLAGEEATLRAGEGTVIKTDDGPVGVSRSESGDLHAVSAVCPHMKCVLRWNDGEASWDCPCHGSRFTPEGRVLDGPAIEDLPRRTAREK
ncbi:FAD-dependent oxidoreductase [Halalkalicoccus jeotgali]|uniref:FAD dependent oxidoreductase n=1 Tax=Halalkalicoccus jeotgali (strain DSM 18796 / CECT 7217 / JCM 14584 / KCTC 4019 / B3) TaxID=795797 RepID=D8J2J7_HALJB|nr:FAD-dependent oxidoreductase [Halalkalicoccus jeotgali]ADJ14954.1 FAD dependent oxidoreductase [Halalkalicoccus jeotgali B3]ELY35030.1 FAD dependent oxidoreductase [Halalkalicoccus jeotgali B3]